MTFRIILTTHLPDSTDANGIKVIGNTMTEIRLFDKLANVLAFVANHDPLTVMAFQVYAL